MTLAGCGGTHPSSNAATSPLPDASRSPSPSPPASSPTPDQPSSSADASATATPSVAGCLTRDLHGSLGGADGALGSIYFKLRLTNTGDAPCALGGYGGVSFVGGHGQQIGAAAQRDHSTGVRLVVLQPGQTADAQLKVAEAGNYDAADCRPQTAKGLRVYPPNETASLFVPHRFDACASPAVQLLTIKPYRAADPG